MKTMENNCEHVFENIVKGSLICSKCGLEILNQLEILNYSYESSVPNYNYFDKSMYTIEQKLLKNKDFPKDLVKSTVEVYKTFCTFKKNKHLVSLKINNTVILATCFYYVAKDLDRPYIGKEITKIFDISEKRLMKGIKLFSKFVYSCDSNPFKETSLENAIKTPIDINIVIRRYLELIEVPEDLHDIIYTLVNYFIDKSILYKNTYEAVVFITIAYICYIRGDIVLYKRTMNTIEVSNPTIMKGYKTLCNYNAEIYDLLKSKNLLEKLLN